MTGILPNIQAQNTSNSNWRSKKISTHTTRIILDSLSIVPGSFHMDGIATDQFQLNELSATLTWLKPPNADSIRVRYRVLPLSFSRQYYHKDRRMIDSLIVFNYLAPGSTGTGNGHFVDFNTLDYNGSYGRSISLGNNQDAALTSHFNLQANGYLSDSIKLEAAISDNTLPFQPEGNTQRLQEFDQVYIRLSRHRQLLQLGDYTIEKPKGYFLNLNKRVQGLYYSNGFKISPHVDNSFAVSGSVAKGDFVRNIFQGLEGNQGPYKLTGNNGEQFFIVLAGTEKVYINGLIQERGENADYTINYNTAEIRFMPRRLITKDSRIQVEFEYQSRNYLNSLIYAWDEIQVGKKLNLHLNVYSNQDAKNQGYQQSLNGDQKRFLGSVGDSINNAYYPVVTLDTFAASKILYKLIDTLIAGHRYDSVYIYSISPDSAKYNLSFSYVGPGKGDYIISSRAVNGRAYDWLPPNGGQHQGDYAPVQLLVTPKMQQVMSLVMNYQIDSLKSVNVEWSASNYNPNLFSDIPYAEHLGLAAKLHYKEQRPLGTSDSLGKKAWNWQNDLDYEFVQGKFQAIAPYRNVEFSRDWNVPVPGLVKPDENLAGYTTSLQNRKYGTISYGFGYYGTGYGYTGYRNILGYSNEQKRWKTALSLNLLQAQDSGWKSVFFRPSALAEYRLPKLNHGSFGVQYQEESNSIRDRLSDSLYSTAYLNHTMNVYFRTADNQPLHYSLNYAYRSDALPRGSDFLRQSHSHTIDARLGIARSKNQVLSFTGSYRRLIVDDSLFNNQQGEETGLGRLEYTGNFLKGAIRLQTLYEAGAGQEQKRTYTYVEVPAGQGVYTWIDYNNDGVQQPNEFEIALYPDQKKFIRIFTPTNEYVRVNYVTYNQSLSLEPALIFGKGKLKGWKGVVARFTDQGSLQITNRLTNTSAGEALNPFIPSLRDDRIIIANTSLSNTLFFNRSNPTFGMEYSYIQNSSKQLLTYGVEGISTTQNTARIRWNLSTAFTSNMVLVAGERGYESALSDGRTYAVHNYSGEPSLTWIHHGVIRITGTLHYENRMNADVYGGETAQIGRTDLEFRYSKPVSGVLVIRGSYAGIRYDGLTTAPVAFTMLDALQPGANYLWYANWDRRLSKGIEVSLEYEGRKPGGSAAVHTGRMTLRAIL